MGVTWRALGCCKPDFKSLDMVSAAGPFPPDPNSRLRFLFIPGYHNSRPPVSQQLNLEHLPCSHLP